MSKFDPKSPKGSVPNVQSKFPNRYAIRWFKCKLKPPKNWKKEILRCGLEDLITQYTPNIRKSVILHIGDSWSSVSTFKRDSYLPVFEFEFRNCF